MGLVLAEGGGVDLVVEVGGDAEAVGDRAGDLDRVPAAGGVLDGVGDAEAGAADRGRVDAGGREQGRPLVQEAGEGLAGGRLGRGPVGAGEDRPGEVADGEPAAGLAEVQRSMRALPSPDISTPISSCAGVAFRAMSKSRVPVWRSVAGTRSGTACPLDFVSTHSTP
jgi:hypothetical protein